MGPPQTPYPGFRISRSQSDIIRYPSRRPQLRHRSPGHGRRSRPNTTPQRTIKLPKSPRILPTRSGTQRRRHRRPLDLQRLPPSNIRSRRANPRMERINRRKHTRPLRTQSPQRPDLPPRRKGTTSSPERRHGAWTRDALMGQFQRER